MTRARNAITGIFASHVRMYRTHISLSEMFTRGIRAECDDDMVTFPMNDRTLWTIASRSRSAIYARCMVPPAGIYTKQQITSSRQRYETTMTTTTSDRICLNCVHLYAEIVCHVFISASVFRRVARREDDDRPFGRWLDSSRSRVLINILYTYKSLCTHM